MEVSSARQESRQEVRQKSKQDHQGARGWYPCALRAPTHPAEQWPTQTTIHNESPAHVLKKLKPSSGDGIGTWLQQRWGDPKPFLITVSTLHQNQRIQVERVVFIGRERIELKPTARRIFNEFLWDWVGGGRREKQTNISLGQGMRLGKQTRKDKGSRRKRCLTTVILAANIQEHLLCVQASQQRLANFPWKEQDGLVDHMVSVTATQLCLCSMKAKINELTWLDLALRP